MKVGSEEEEGHGRGTDPQSNGLLCFTVGGHKVIMAAHREATLCEDTLTPRLWPPSASEIQNRRLALVFIQLGGSESTLF